MTKTVTYYGMFASGKDPTALTGVFRNIRTGASIGRTESCRPEGWVDNPDAMRYLLTGELSVEEITWERAKAFLAKLRRSSPTNSTGRGSLPVRARAPLPTCGDDEVDPEG